MALLVTTSRPSTASKGFGHLPLQGRVEPPLHQHAESWSGDPLAQLASHHFRDGVLLQGRLLHRGPPLLEQIAQLAGAADAPLGIEVVDRTHLIDGLLSFLVGAPYVHELEVVDRLDVEAGRLADLVTLDGEALALAGLDGDMVLDGWIFAGDDRAVRDVWSAGRRLVMDGRHYAREAVEARYRAVLARLRDAA